MILRKIKKYSALLLSAILGFSISTSVFAQAKPLEKLQKFAGQSGYAGDNAPTTPAVYIGQVLAILYGFLGVIALVYIVYAGFLWLTANINLRKSQNTFI